MLSSSKIKFDKQKQSTLVTKQLSINPLKIINPKTIGNTAICMLTNYGGGYIEGDKVKLEVECEKETTSIISSQANTRVYESDGKMCQQEINITLKPKSFHVFFNDPLVLHKGAMFSQINEFSLSKDACLIFVDWFSAGRTRNNEAFDFEMYDSETVIYVEKEKVVWDHFKILPKEQSTCSPAVFLDTKSYLNIFLIGNKDLKKVKIISRELKNMHIATSPSLKYNFSRINNNAFIGRACAVNILTLHKIVSQVSTILNDSALLNFDFLERKY